MLYSSAFRDNVGESVDNDVIVTEIIVHLLK